MRYVAVALVCVVVLTLSWWPSWAVAQEDASPLQDLLEQNIEIAYDPPQASSEALVALPSIYIRPGSALYWLKHTSEEVRLFFTSDPEQKSQLMLEFSQRRLAEGYDALQEHDWQSAQKALEGYQLRQSDVATLLREMQRDGQDIEALLELLRDQLGMQQALQQYVTEQVPAGQQPVISSLLDIRPNQTLALAVAEHGALLGEQSTQSAQPQSSQSAQASPTAVPSGMVQ